MRLLRKTSGTVGSRVMGRLACGVLAAGALASGGCYWEGGAGYAWDQHTYVSTSWQPKTVTLRDTRTGQDIWSADVPVGKQLVLKFSRDANYEDPERPGTKDEYNTDVMRWGIMDDESLWEPLPNSIRVPDRNSRRVDVTLRAAPELPGDGQTNEPVNEPPTPVNPEGSPAEAGAAEQPAGQ